MLYQIMHKAETNDLILKNPVRFADKMHYREPKKRKEAFSAAEVSILMEKLPKDKIGLSIRLLLGTGMRTQELLALEPRHIALDGSTIQSIVGHADIEMTEHYLHVQEEVRQSAIDKFSRAFAPKSDPPKQP